MIVYYLIGIPIGLSFALGFYLGQIKRDRWKGHTLTMKGNFGSGSEYKIKRSQT